MGAQTEPLVFNVQYGVAVIRPVALFRIVSPPPTPLSPTEQFREDHATTWNVLLAAGLIIGSSVCVIGTSLALLAVHAETLSFLAGAVVGLGAFGLWLEHKRG